MTCAHCAEFHCHPTFWRINECRESLLFDVYALALIIVLRKKVAAGMRDRRRAKFTSYVGLFAWRVASGRHILVAITVNTRYLHFVFKVECRNDISLTGKWLVSDTGVSIIR